MTSTRVSARTSSSVSCRSALRPSDSPYGSSVETEPSVRAALLLALGENPKPGKPPEISDSFAQRLAAEYATDPDPGFHAAAFWLLGKCGRAGDAVTADLALKGKAARPATQRWYVNGEGQTFVIIKDPEVFAMGSPTEENALGRNRVEKLHQARIPRSFAISAREVTVAEFNVFLSDPAAKGIDYSDENQKQYGPLRDGPILYVTWFEAAKYCRWLTEREGIAPDQQCFPEIAEIRENMTIPRNYLSLIGYRLPTEAEWEYACRAGTETPWSFGSNPALLKEFACHLSGSSPNHLPMQTAKTRSSRPNALGVFDMHGNVSEWCFDRYEEYPEAGGKAVDDREQGIVVIVDRDSRSIRGGSFEDPPQSVRSAFRDSARPTTKYPSVGFRIARTMPR